MTALVSTLAGWCSHADGHFPAQHTINFPELILMTTKALGTPSPCSQIPLEKRNQMDENPNASWRSAHGPRVGTRKDVHLYFRFYLS